MRSWDASTSNANPPRPHRALWWLAGTVIAVLWPCLRAGLVYDDWINFDRNVALRDNDWMALITQPYYGSDTTYWRPLTSLLMGLSYRAGPFGVHALALAAHLLTAFVVGAIGRVLLCDPMLALFAALLFALHPLQVESVAWASALPGVLSGLFLLLAVRAALLWSMRTEPCRPWSIAVWLVAALLSKESGAVAIPLLTVIMLGAGGPRSAAAKCIVVLAAAAVVWGWFAVHKAMVGYRPLVSDPDTLIAGIAQMTVRQASLLLLPWPLTPFRPHPDAIGGGAVVAMAIAIAVSGIALAGWFWQRLQPRWRIAGALAAAPLLLSAVTYQAVGPHPLSDRYLYTSVSGFCLLLVAAVGRRFLLLSLLAAVYGAVSFVQSHVWLDDQVFADHAVAASPEAPGPRVLAGAAASRAGGAEGLRQSREHYRAAIALLGRHTDADAKRMRAAALAGLSWCEFSDPNGDAPPALAAGFCAALAEDPKNVPAWVGLGVACGLNGQHDEALAALHSALALDPLCPEAWFNLAQTQRDLGQLESARESLRQALRAHPDLTAATQLLAALR